MAHQTNRYALLNCGFNARCASGKFSAEKNGHVAAVCVSEIHVSESQSTLVRRGNLQGMQLPWTVENTQRWLDTMTGIYNYYTLIKHTSDSQVTMQVMAITYTYGNTWQTSL